MEKISRSSVRQRWIDALMREGYTRDDIATAAKVTPRQVSRWRSAGETYEPDDGQVYLIATKLQVDPPCDIDVDGMSRRLPERESDALRNAGVIVRNARTGKLWFAITFPDHMPVINPYVIDVEQPGPHDPEAEPVKKSEDVA